MEVIRQRNELYVNLDTKSVKRRAIDEPKAENVGLCFEEKPVHVAELRSQSKRSRSEALEAGHSVEQHGPMSDTIRFKFPPGRGEFLGENNIDERGSIRDSERESSC